MDQGLYYIVLQNYKLKLLDLNQLLVDLILNYQMLLKIKKHVLIFKMMIINVLYGAYLRFFITIPMSKEDVKIKLVHIKNILMK